MAFSCCLSFSEILADSEESSRHAIIVGLWCIRCIKCRLWKSDEKPRNRIQHPAQPNGKETAQTPETESGIKQQKRKYNDDHQAILNKQPVEDK